MSNQLTTQAKEKFQTIKSVLEARKSNFKEVLPNYLTPERLFRITYTAMSKNPNLLNCSPASLVLALMDAAQGGMEVDGKHGALVPYGKECKFQPMYQGMIKVAILSGAAKDVGAVLVYANDEFDYSRTNGIPKVFHRPALDGNREVIAAYAYAILPDGTVKIEVMETWELDKIKNKAQSKSGPWSEWTEEMYKKTAIKRLLKNMATSERLDYAIAVDNQNEAGRSRVEMPIIDVVPEDLQEPKQTATEKLAEKTKKRGRPPKETEKDPGEPETTDTTSPEPHTETISSDPLPNHSDESAERPAHPDDISEIWIYLKRLKKEPKDFGIEDMNALTNDKAGEVLGKLMDLEAAQLS